MNISKSLFNISFTATGAFISLIITLLIWFGGSAGFFVDGNVGMGIVWILFLGYIVGAIVGILFVKMLATALPKLIK